MKRFASTLYLPLRRNSKTRDYEPDPDGYLFAKGVYRTKIKPCDLPEWYVRGYIHRQEGFVSAKHVKHLLYKPNYATNHLHKDDLLFISYDKPIEPDAEGTHGIWYHGYAHIVHGPMIVDYLEAVAKHSDYDTKEIMREVRKKERWYNMTYGK